MNNENTCLSFAEELSGSRPPSRTLIAHTETCPGCRAAFNALQEIRREQSAFSPAEVARLSDGVCRRLFAPEAAVAPAEPRESIFERLALLFSGKTWAFALTCAVLLLIVVFPFAQRSQRESSTSSVSYQVAWADGRSGTFPLAVPFRLDQASARITAPDRTVLEVADRAVVQVQNRGFHLSSGSLTADVPPGATVFRGSTPHGMVEVLGTRFECRVLTAETVVRVLSGRVRLVGTGAPVNALVEGQTGRLTEPVARANASAPSAPVIPIVDLNGE